MSKILIELKGKVSKIFTSITHMNPYTKGFLDGMFMIIAIVCICRMPIINIKDSGYSFSNVDRIINVIGYIILLRFLIREFFLFSVKGNTTIGFRYIPFLVIIFQFIACSFDNRIADVIFVLSVFVFLLIIQIIVPKEKRNMLCQSFKFSTAIFIFFSAFINFIYKILSDKYLLKKNLGEFIDQFYTTAFILAIFIFYIAILERKLFQEEQKSSKDVDIQSHK